MTAIRHTLAWGLVLLNLFVWSAVTGCAGPLNARQKAVKAAQLSHATYESLRPVVTRNIVSLVETSRTRSLAREEKSFLAGLNRLRLMLDEYAELHNAFVNALVVGTAKVGESPIPPDNLNLEETRLTMNSLLNQIIDMALNMGLKFNAVRP